MNMHYTPRQSAPQTAPFVAFIDLQINSVRPESNHVKATAVALDKCKSLLTAARQIQVPIGHFHRTYRSSTFRRCHDRISWIPDLRPRPNEYIYERFSPSCFDNKDFLRLAENANFSEIIIASLGGESSGLSTMVDGFHRGYRMTFVTDCSVSSATGFMSEETTHHAVTSLAMLYGRAIDLEDVLRDLARRQIKGTGS